MVPGGAPEDAWCPMSDEACPRCRAKITDPVLYKCIRCYTVYCKACDGSDAGRRCPGCGMTHRMVLSQDR
jgi:hypothetical protein